MENKKRQRGFEVVREDKRTIFDTFTDEKGKKISGE